MNLHPGMEGSLIWLFVHSLQAGVLVLVVLFVQWIFRRQLTNRWRFALWWIVLARLLLPFNPESSLSLFNFVHPNVHREAPIKSEPAPSTTITENRVGATTPSTIQPAPMENHPAPVILAPDSPPPVQTAPSVPAAKPPHNSLSVSNLLIPGLVGIWLTGVLGLMGVVAAQLIRFYGRLAKTTRPADENLQALLGDCQREFGLSRRIELLETDAVQSPALFGCLRLRLLLPRGIGGQFAGPELRYMFLHELAHVKRGDLWLNWLVTVLQILHWFNPLLWLGFARLRADRELACDELALLRAGDKAGIAYGETVVKLLENLDRPAAIPGLVGILEDKKQMRRRIFMIANFRKPGRRSMLAVFLVAGMATVALTDAESNSPGKAAVKTETTTVSTNEMNLSETNFFKVAVTVLDAKTSQPISGAKIMAPYLSFRTPLDTNDWIRVTDKQGIAMLKVPKLPDERMQNFSITVTATNYADRSVMWVSDSGKVLATLPDSYTFHLEKGISIGGFVHDEHGQPVTGATVVPWGSGYRGFSMGTGQQLHQEYSEVSRYGGSGNQAATGVTTDVQGFWKTEKFPADLTAVRIDVVRPGGARSQFTTEVGQENLSVEQASRISLNDLLTTNVMLELKAGSSIRGLVVDSFGKPVAGVRLKARGGQVSQTPVYMFTNNPDGRFQLNHWTVPQFVITAEADGFATKTMVLSTADSAAVKQIILPPAKPLVVRVLGESNEPVAGAIFRIIDWRSGNQLVNWNGTTDASGLAVWTNAPDKPVSFRISTTNYPTLAVKLLGDDQEKTVHLRKGMDKNISLNLTVTDAESGNPISEFTVRRSLQWNRTLLEWGNPGTNGEFRSEIASSEFQLGTVDYFKLQVSATNYLPWTSDDLYFDEGDQDLKVKLDKGTSPTGIVLQPDGNPAADAKVVLCLADGASVFFNAPNRSYPGQGSVSERTSSDGSFHLAGADDGKYIVAWHSSGFATLTVGDLRRNKEVHLQPWAGVEGVIKIDGKPVANENVDIQAPMGWNALEGFNLVYDSKTDADGHFQFTNLPPGSCVLYRQPHIIYGVPTKESHRWPIELKPGENQHVDYTFGGRQIVGHIETEVPVDWQNDAHLLVLKTPPPPDAPTYWSYVNKADYEQARRAFTHSPEFLASERQQQQFQLLFDKDGNFHADDVPPGNYELRILVTKPPKNNNERYSSQREELGSLTREIRVPDGRGSFDLGTLKMTVKPGLDQPDEPAKPAELEAKDFEGRPLTLNQFKGKHVLLVFWASWSDRCTEQMADLPKLQSEFGLDGRFVILGVNTDGTSEIARQAVKTHGYSWPQAWLDEPDLAKATATFDVSSMPSYCLVGPDGCIIAHDLNRELVRVTLQRALKSK